MSQSRVDLYMLGVNPDRLHTAQHEQHRGQDGTAWRPKASHRFTREAGSNPRRRGTPLMTTWEVALLKEVSSRGDDATSTSW